MSIKIGILGYGNLAKGVESAIMQNDDLELAAVFTRRDPASVSIRTAGVPVLLEYMKVKALSKPTSLTMDKVSRKSSSVSPGKPTIMSVVREISGITSRSLLTRSI